MVRFRLTGFVRGASHREPPGRTGIKPVLNKAKSMPLEGAWKGRHEGTHGREWTDPLDRRPPRTRARRVRRAALSNTPLAELQEILAVRRLQELLDIVRGGGNWPKSQSLLRLLREFHLPPGECLFLGDGRGDLDAARSAGVRFVAIDAGTGEFSNEQGFDGPYRNLGAWGVEFLGIRMQKESASQLEER